jgi:hypothetical protein
VQRESAPAPESLLTEAKSMTEFPPDQLTAHESVPDEAHVGRFSRGLEALPQTADKLHRGRFSAGLEQLPETPRKRHPGRFSEGLETVHTTATLLQRGSFADGVARLDSIPDDAA